MLNWANAIHSFFFTFLPLREQSEELGIYLIYNFTKLLGIVLEIEIINFYDEHLALIPQIRNL